METMEYSKCESIVGGIVLEMEIDVVHMKVEVEPDPDLTDFQLKELKPGVITFGERVTGVKQKHTCSWCKGSFISMMDTFESKPDNGNVYRSIPDTTFCETCQKLYNCKVIISDISKLLLCKLCGKYSFTSKQLMEHKLNFCTKGAKSTVKRHYYQCDTCKKILFSRYNLLKHLKRGHKKLEKLQKFSCDICTKTFCSSQNLNRHRRSKHTDIVKKITSAEKHNSDTYNEDFSNIKCDLCEKWFQRIYKLKEHLLKHNESKFTCSVCYEEVVTKDMIIHKNAHHKSQIICDVCNKSFSFRSNMMRHKKEFHTNSKRRSAITVCGICNKPFNSRRNFVYHLASHSNNRPYTCEICDKHFKRIDHLRNHNVIHTGEKRFKCEICSKAFNRQSNLIAHEQSHDAEQVTCPICYVVRKNSRYFKDHVRSHHNSPLKQTS